MPKTTSPDDPRGLIADAYAIDGIEEPECRSIFLDWSLDPRVSEPVTAAARLHGQWGARAPDHPMTGVLAAAAAAPKRGRRGGREGRR